MNLEQAREIAARLRPVLEEQGLDLEVLGEADGVVRVRLLRAAPGAPASVLARALEGTFRRYLPGFRGLLLEPAPEEPRVGPGPPPAGPTFQGLPGVDLSGMDRRLAARALDAFADLVRRRGGTRFRVRGLAEDAPLRAARKWTSFFRQDLGPVHPEGDRDDTWIIHLAGECPRRATCGVGEEGETLPARVLLVDLS